MNTFELKGEKGILCISEISHIKEGYDGTYYSVYFKNAKRIIISSKEYRDLIEKMKTG